jgi:hypothetical protein
MRAPLSVHTADVVVVGGGAAGVAAAMSAADNGASVLLVERGTSLGGELVGGLPYLSVANAGGEWIVGGPTTDLLEAAAALGGYAGRPFDGRAMWGACVDPEVMKLVVVEALAERGVTVLIGCGVTEAVVDDGTVVGLLAQARSGAVMLRAAVYVDASGDGDVVALSGGRLEQGDEQGRLQPVSLTFRMSHIDFAGYLAWFADHPEQFNLAENPAFGLDRAAAAAKVVESGLPFCVLDGQRTDTLLGTAIADGSMYPTTAIWMWPTSIARGEMGFNTTRASGVDGTDSAALGRAGATLAGQVRAACQFMTATLPGFEGAHLSGVAPKVGIRETRRVVGIDTLDTASVVEGRKRPDGVARGAHHVDVHGDGTSQVRRYVEGGRSYDIPYGALVPAGLDNVLVAGRCLSSTREANGSARVIGTCLAMGQAAGTAATMTNAGRVGGVDVADLRARITEQGGVVDGTL